ncbi:copper resistance protein NlpE N-terminal domain-containing protein [Flavobacterium sp. xlx-214]|uniref:copper resistance protein NlpE n=1 Tax=unclassified Flavobacterium TaxID=196869 RepID=UPI0013D88DC3|nr:MULTISPECIES: copper resistance protein NlpE [unclassified Flavobacterium]MBA5792639.1 copper resistance protein NlpE N-terminal domain-containing protein [Flavobacterium sp. xlx-221]QMI83788.1 copper resistance protein NlpE N-terminal domain-containing protein [Flavobacterium sp. xlx-214]
MKKIFLLALVTGATLTACTKKTDAPVEDNSMKNDSLVEQKLDTITHDGHNAENSLDWAGTYEATLPCADCPGIKTTIIITKDGAFTYLSEYLERNTNINNTGTIMWHDNGSVIHLKGKDIDSKLKVIENGLIALDQDGKEIDGPLKAHYRFTKIK